MYVLKRKSFVSSFTHKYLKVKQNNIYFCWSKILRKLTWNMSAGWWRQNQMCEMGSFVRSNEEVWNLEALVCLMALRLKFTKVIKNRELIIQSSCRKVKEERASDSRWKNKQRTQGTKRMVPNSTAAAEQETVEHDRDDEEQRGGDEDGYHHSGRGTWKHAAFHVATTIATPAAYAPLPFALASLGWPLGVISLVSATLATWYSSLLVASLWRWDANKHVTYRNLAQSIFGWYFCSNFFKSLTK